MVIKQEFTFPSSDWVHTVAAAWWRPEGPPRGVVQLVHCISEHIGRYDSFARFLAEHGYAIAREALVRDRGFLYPVIEAGAGEMHLTLGRQWAGADLLYDPLGDRYIIEKIIQLQAAAAGSNRASAPEARERGDYARAVITELLQMREEWRHANCPGN